MGAILWRNCICLFHVILIRPQHYVVKPIRLPYSPHSSTVELGRGRVLVSDESCPPTLGGDADYFWLAVLPIRPSTVELGRPDPDVVGVHRTTLGSVSFWLTVIVDRRARGGRVLVSLNIYVLQCFYSMFSVSRRSSH